MILYACTGDLASTTARLHMQTGGDAHRMQVCRQGELLHTAPIHIISGII